MSLYLVILTQQYVAEKRFVKDTEAIRLQEYYMLCSLKQAESLLLAGSMQGTGSMEYQEGSVAYFKTSLSSNMEEVTFTVILDTGERAIGIGRYDKEKGKMVKWIERN